MIFFITLVPPIPAFTLLFSAMESSPVFSKRAVHDEQSRGRSDTVHESRLKTYQHRDHSSAPVVQTTDGKGKGKGTRSTSVQRPSNQTDYEGPNVRFLVDALQQNPLIKATISVGDVQLTVSNNFALAMLLSGQAYYETSKALYVQKSSRHSAYELRQKVKEARGAKDGDDLAVEDQ